MKKSKEEFLIELLETKSYDELSAEERSLVNEEMSESEYQLQRKVLLEAAEMDQDAIPAPLVLPGKTRILPLILTASVSAAAAVVIMFLFMPKESIELNFGVKSAATVVETDTVYVEKLVVDTVVQRIIKKEYVVSTESSPQSGYQLEMYAGAGQSTPVIPTSALVNQGRNAKEDQELSQFRPPSFFGM